MLLTLTRSPARAPVVQCVASGETRKALWKPGEVSPAYLDGSLPGDAGFDPLCMAALAKMSLPDLLSIPKTTIERSAVMERMPYEQQRASVEWMREAEIKHARLAMLAAVGWPFAELINPWLDSTGGRAPSLFNGGLFDGPVPFFLVLAAGAAALLENVAEERANQRWRLSEDKAIAGDYGFDPLGFSKEEGAFRQRELRANELFNGRLASETTWVQTHAPEATPTSPMLS
jgi:hypothetical protein